MDLNVVPAEGLIGCEKLQSSTEVQILEEQNFLSKLRAPNFKGQVNLCSHLFVQNLMTEKHSSLVSHTISTANKVKKPEAASTSGRDGREYSRGRQFNIGFVANKRKAASPKNKVGKSATPGGKEMFSKKVESTPVLKKEISKDQTVKSVKINIPL